MFCVSEIKHPCLLKIMDIFTLVGLWEIVLLGFQPQPHYQKSKSLVNNSPTFYPPLKEMIRGWWEGQKTIFKLDRRKTIFVSFIPILVARTKVNLHHLKKKIVGNFNWTFYTYKALQWCFKCQCSIWKALYRQVKFPFLSVEM